MYCCTSPIIDFRARSIDISISEEELDLSLLLAEGNGTQEANLNAGYHCDPIELRFLHPFWKYNNLDMEKEDYAMKPSGKRVAFGEKTINQICDEKEKFEEDTDFVERGDKALCKVVKIIEASIDSSRSIIPILVELKEEKIIQDINDILKDIIDVLKTGKVYRVANSSSLRIKPCSYTIDSISRAHIVFQYFMNLTREEKDS